MSEYTTTVRYICEFYNNQNKSTGYSTIESVIENSYSKIFDFNYPIFDESYKSILEKKILKYFYLYEICCETASEWKLFLCNKLNEIMPYYNQLYNSEKIKIEPFITNDTTTTYTSSKNESNETHRNLSGTLEGTNTESTTDNASIINNEKTTKIGSNAITSAGENKTTTNSSGENNSVKNIEHNENNEKTSIFSDYPQATSDLTNGTYASGKNYEKTIGSGKESQSDTLTKTENITNTITSTKNDSENINESNTLNRGEKTTRKLSAENARTENTTNTENANSTNEGTENYTSNTKGFSNANQSELLLKYRETFVNIDQMIINDLRSLFFTLY